MIAQCPSFSPDTSDAGAFERLYGEYSGAAYRTALRVLGNSTQAQDVVQDVFMRLWGEPQRFEVERGTLENYVRLLARSRALDMWREGRVARRAGDRLKVLALHDEARAEYLPARAAELRRDRTIVLAALSRLPAPQRQAIVLAYWGGLTAAEISEQSGVAVGTVKSRLRLGLRHLHDRCEHRLDGDLTVAA